MSDSDKIEALTVLCRHLIDCIDAMFTADSQFHLTNVGKAIAPSLVQAKSLLQEVYRIE